MDELVRFRQLHKAFAVRRSIADTIRAPFAAATMVPGLVDVSGTVHAGELFGVLGPNGAGKSTLFRILATYLLPDGGSASIAGFDVQTQPGEARREVACVMANERALFWRLSAYENLRLYAALQGIAPTDRDRLIREALSVVDMGNVGARAVGTFSSGQRQRVLLARALMARPRVLLLDEPTRSLDPVSARQFRDFVRARIIGEFGCTVIVATHDSDEAFDWCDRVMVMHHGRSLLEGTAESMAQRFGDAIVGIWTSTPSADAFDDVVRRGLAHRVIRDIDASADEWGCVRLALRNGPEASAAVLAYLIEQGVPISRFERLDRSLADLLTRVVNADRTATEGVAA